MINIDDRFYIDIDSMNYILKERKINKSGKNKGSEYFTAIGFYNTVENAFEAYLELMTRETLSGKALTVKEAVREIKASHDTALMLLKAHI